MSDANRPLWATPEITTLRHARQAMSGDNSTIFETGGNFDASSTPSGAT